MTRCKTNAEHRARPRRNALAPRQWSCRKEFHRDRRLCTPVSSKPRRSCGIPLAARCLLNAQMAAPSRASGLNPARAGARHHTTHKSPDHAAAAAAVQHSSFRHRRAMRSWTFSRVRGQSSCQTRIRRWRCSADTRGASGQATSHGLTPNEGTPFPAPPPGASTRRPSPSARRHYLFDAMRRLRLTRAERP